MLAYLLLPQVTAEGAFTLLHTFNGSDGCYPLGGLIQGSDGNIYGATGGGSTGQPANVGDAASVFGITPDGIETTLYSFSCEAVSDGCYPGAGLIQASDGNFYGTTSNGGTNSGGTAFQITPAGALTFLCSFADSSGGKELGDEPSTNLVQGSDGNFYSATFEGGAYNRGYFFRLVLNSQ